MLVKILYWTLLFFLIRNIWRLVKATRLLSVSPKVRGRGFSTEDFQHKSKPSSGSTIEAEYTVLDKDK